MHKVLVVETDRTFREWLRMHLVTHGVAATALADDRKALESVKADPPDLVIISTDLPRNGAFALAAAMRSNVQTTPLPMLFLVSPDDREALAQCMSIEPEGVITKPLSRNALLEAVATRLSAARHQPGLVQRTPALEPFLPAPSTGHHPAMPSGLLVEVKDATMLIVVVRNLVSLARAFSAKALDALLTRFVSAAREAVLERAGRILRADATGLTAHFEDAPGESGAHAARAIETALAAAVAARRVKHWAEKNLTGSPGPELSVGCGAHTGEVVLARLSLSGSVPPCIAGQTADLVTRLDGRAKGLGWSVAVSQACAQLAGPRFQMGRQSSLNDTDHGVIIPIVEITGLNPGAARPGEFDFMAEVREAVLANTMLAALAGDADQRVTERTIVVPATRRADNEVLPELPDRRIERRVGRAASATVYLGVHLPTGRRERLVCLQGADHHETFIERYLDEYRHLAQIQQRNVLSIHEIGRHKRLAYVATEALHGETLGEAMRRELPIGLALNCLAQMCMAVNALHNAGIVHGSLQATDFSFRDDRVLVLAELNVNDRVRAALGMDNAGFDRRARTFGDAGGDFRAIGRIFHAMLVGTAQSTLPDSPQASTLELFRATRLPLSLSPVQPCLDRLLGVGSAAPMERAEDVLVELLSLKELFPFDTALGQLEGNPGLRRVGP